MNHAAPSLTPPSTSTSTNPAAVGSNTGSRPVVKRPTVETFPPRSFWIIQPMVRMLSQWVSILIFGVRHHGLHKVPKVCHGGTGCLLLCNHQSHLDPSMIGQAFGRRPMFVARDTLFRGVFGRLIASLGAFPIIRGRRDEDALGLAVNLAERGFFVIVFGEGTRSETGDIRTIRGGIEIMARRAKVPIWPAVVDGARECFPKGQDLLEIQAHTVHVIEGEAVMPSDYLGWPERSMPGRLRERLIELQSKVRGIRAQAGPGVTTLSRVALELFLSWVRGCVSVLRWMGLKRKKKSGSHRSQEPHDA